MRSRLPRTLPEWHADFRSRHPLRLRSPKRRRLALDFEAVAAVAPALAGLALLGALLLRCAAGVE